ncbi:RrF2 family transcriptional regulator [Clostridium aminobutyricum]|uniref:Rrf2 family transcriptional regulator n=1 Tax=Clostridium aminobutyricum TaxID=33953 RepID=A0A939D6N0_CLOAM|nr:Rrf2 family transcriptional regulator [Clostridium aminobutyricum]MBN7772217.1 Rrf2 family transcriptional regulator [Clostridium aminobutyricum]
MKISTKGRYGLQALLDLAIYGENDYISLKSVAERQGMSDNYLEQLFAALKKNGLVESTRGAQGGYRLSKDASEITVRQVLNALEGPLALVDCIIEGNQHECDRFECCVTRVLWQKIMDELNEVTDAISLADLVECHKQARLTASLEYYI